MSEPAPAGSERRVAPGRARRGQGWAGFARLGRSRLPLALPVVVLLACQGSTATAPGGDEADGVSVSVSVSVSDPDLSCAVCDLLGRDAPDMERLVEVAGAKLSADPSTASTAVAGGDAEGATPFVWHGGYVLAAPEQVEIVLAEAVEGAVAGFPLLVRPLARARLQRVVRVSASMSFLSGHDSMTIRSDEGHDWKTDLKKTKVVVVDRFGEPLTLSRWMDGRVLYDRASRGPDSSTFAFRPSDDGSTFTMAVSTSSPQLQAPIRYEVAYRRE